MGDTRACAAVSAPTTPRPWEGRGTRGARPGTEALGRRVQRGGGVFGYSAIAVSEGSSVASNNAGGVRGQRACGAVRAGQASIPGGSSWRASTALCDAPSHHTALPHPPGSW